MPRGLFAIAVAIATFMGIISLPLSKANALDLKELIEIAMENHPAIHAARADAQAKQARIIREKTPGDIVVGYSELNRGNETRYGTVSQKIDFPYKYFLRGDIAEENHKTAQEYLTKETVEIVSNLKKTFYQYYSITHEIDLIDQNIRAVKDFSRVAEAKYASGKASQHDSMRSHVEVTRLEIERLNLKSRQARIRKELLALLDYRIKESELVFSAKLIEPTVEANLKSRAQKLASEAPEVKIARSKTKSAKLDKTLSQWEFVPDFQASYQRRISGRPEDSDILSIGVTIPLWFWNDRANLRESRAKYKRYEALTRAKENQVRSEIEASIEEVLSDQKILQVFRTSLIPQAETSFRLAAANYRASKGSFLDFLDSEKAYYGVQREYFQALSRFAKNVAAIEAKSGKVIANWQRGEN